MTAMRRHWNISWGDREVAETIGGGSLSRAQAVSLLLWLCLACKLEGRAWRRNCWEVSYDGTVPEYPQTFGAKDILNVRDDQGEPPAI